MFSLKAGILTKQKFTDYLNMRNSPVRSAISVCKFKQAKNYFKSKLLPWALEFQIDHGLRIEWFLASRSTDPAVTELCHSSFLVPAHHLHHVLKDCTAHVMALPTTPSSTLCPSVWPLLSVCSSLHSWIPIYYLTSNQARTMLYSTTCLFIGILMYIHPQDDCCPPSSHIPKHPSWLLPKLA